MHDPGGGAFTAAKAGAVPLEAVHQLQQERDHLLLLHEALDDVKRAPSRDAKLRVFVEAIRRVGFGRVTITLRDENLDATTIVTAGLSPEDDERLRTTPEAGDVWRGLLSRAPDGAPWKADLEARLAQIGQTGVVAAVRP